ncbi:ATP-dependent helicase HepA [Rubripirellula tenax]|uniref:ATP-dependent helicase HepA n=1 Tax=Rubripirellula tenax TaxID=2528015 RepID=A0A5C6FES6_9BACT|nr:DEAD/DEAH box helicase [Rubripirellula tenax]TWU59110.1 ATP-dependent helicase HepA [Rubripirellula tenax]
MMLSDVCASEFLSGDRSRGSQLAMQRSVRLTSVGSTGALAIADGSCGEEYVVGVDFSDTQNGRLGVTCDCMRYDGGDPCKHLWAMMKTIDASYDVIAQSPKRLQLFDIDASVLDTGDPLNQRQTNRASAQRSAKEEKRSANEERRLRILEAVRASVNRRDAPTAAQPIAAASIQNQSTGKTATTWKESIRSLGSVSPTSGHLESHGIPREVFAESIVQQQHWFVLSLADRMNEQAFNVQVFESKRKKDGQWGTPVACTIAPSRLPASMTHDERAAFATLQPGEDSGQGNYYNPYRPPTFGQFTVHPSRLDESLEVLHTTGRFAWKLGVGKRFEDARRIDDVDTGSAWQFELAINASPENAKSLVVVAGLKRDGKTIPIRSVMLASDLGCALVELPKQERERECDSDDSSPRVGVIKIHAAQASTIRGWQRVGKVTIPGRSIHTLLTELSANHGSFDLRIDPSIDVAHRLGVPLPQCLLKQREKGTASFNAQLLVRYDDRQIAFDDSVQWWFDRRDKSIVRRDRSAEAEFLNAIDVDHFDLLETFDDVEMRIPKSKFIGMVERLQSVGWEVLAEGVALRIATDFDIAISSGIDWFDLHAAANFDGVDVGLPELLAALRKGDNTILLDDGTLGMLPEEWLKRFAGLCDSGEATDDGLRFKRTQALLLDAMLADHQGVQNDRSFTDFCQKLKSFEGVQAVPAPETFTGKLREYQEIGLGWFGFLQDFGFGGCLADDMGLGKTIQVLALLESRRNRRVPKGQIRKPSIAVVPKSLVFNWIDEAKRFTPDLRVLNHTGLDRHEQLKTATRSLAKNKANAFDLIVTTYGTLRNDAETFSKMEFDYAILDEAQAIKNPKSQSAKAARLLRGDHRLAMTGTPVENHLGDLWSLFDFLNPGMLGGAPKTATLDNDEDRKRIEHVSQSLRPFILRRTKQQVLTELPDKTEQTLVCEMSKPQRKIYDEVREHYRLHLSKKVEELGLKRAKIHVLEALLRLRQVACDPRLVDKKSKVTGAKIENLMQNLTELIDEGHKVLVFSQFTQLLALIRSEVNDRDWDHEYLDGKTRKRDACVKRFQEDDTCQLFLISLKAGGNGLNLTAADYVFILDPWWNPAVEAQAIDRAHRMGQSKSVMAYRMICSNTVEEKIITMQQSKRDLADAIISQDKSLISGLTADDLQQLLA